VPIKVVSERLGHSRVALTLDVYAHVLPAMDRAAADAIGTLFRGGDTRRDGYTRGSAEASAASSSSTPNTTMPA
jgi:hypothetical protein